MYDSTKEIHMIQNRKNRNIVMALFIIYMLCLSKLIMFKFYSMTAICAFIESWSLDSVIQNIKAANLIPIFTTYDAIFNLDRSVALYSIDIVFYNIIAFVPFGMMVPLLFSKINTWKRAAASTFLLSLSFELLQIITTFGVFDIDDILLNTLGGMIGYGVISLVIIKCKPIFAKWIKDEDSKSEPVDRIRKPSKNLYKILAAVLLLVVFLFLNGTIEIGVRASNIEKDARNSAKVEESWKVAKDTTDAMSALLFYDENVEDHRVSIYVKRPGLSFGYFFRSGGNVPDIEENVVEIQVEGCEESAFISMNKQKVSKVIIEEENSTATIDLDYKEKPFAFVVPNTNAKVTFYDINGKVIEPILCVK